MTTTAPPFFTLQLDPTARCARILDQTQLPWRIEYRALRNAEDAAHAIRDMQVRGAPLIGATAACGVALGLAADASDTTLERLLAALAATRPTAVNLHWALARMKRCLSPLAESQRMDAAWREAQAICDADEAANRSIGEHGLALLHGLQRSSTPLRIMTHCNAGRLATVAHGTALAPIYAAQAQGIPLHVWVSETRPRNQGLLTAWELTQAGVPHSVVADNSAGHLLASNQVDLVIVGADRIAANGDAANKIGTYLKALAAYDNGVPFYVAAPLSTIDWQADSGRAIPIEERSGREVRRLLGRSDSGAPAEFALLDDGSLVANPAFDVTPARLISGILSERGVSAPGELRQWAAATPDRTVEMQ